MSLPMKLLYIQHNIIQRQIPNDSIYDTLVLELFLLPKTKPIHIAESPQHGRTDFYQLLIKQGKSYLPNANSLSCLLMRRRT